MAAVYTRIPLVNDAYVKLAGRKWEGRIGLPQLAPPRSPLPDAKVALLSSAGVHLASQQPFDMDNPEGDATVRVIPGDTPLDDLTITHDYYDHSAADRDVNCVFPLERLREFAAMGLIGSVASRHVGFMGHIFGRQQAKLVAQTVGEVSDMFVADDVDLVLAAPG
jgi:D-proline reductase (dithiol) PrdB